MKSYFGGPRNWGRARGRQVLFWSGLLVLGAGCGQVFSAAFVDLLDPSGTYATLDNSTGHVVIGFVNNAEVDELLINYLETPTGGNLVLTDAEKRELRPRIRFRVLVTFANGNTNTVEFVNGSDKLIDQNFDAEAFPDLNQNDLDNMVVLCDVTRVEVHPDYPIEVFVPAPIFGWQLREVQSAAGTDFIVEVVETRQPQFYALQMDDVDADGNTILRRNIGIRDAPGPVYEVGCGGVVTIVVNGVLSIPFQGGVTVVPNYDINDRQTTASIGGRYEFRVSIH